MKKLLFKIKAVEENDTLHIEGWAVKYGITDSTPFKDKLLYGCCSKTLKENKNNIKLLFEHDRSRVIGKIVAFEDSIEGLYIKAQISEAEQEIKTKLKEGLYDSFSIGFLELKNSPIFENDVLKENQITEIALKEVSLVSFPAYKQAKFQVLKSIQDINEDDFENEKELIEKVKSLLEEPNHSQEPNHSEQQPKIDFDFIINNIKLT